MTLKEFNERSREIMGATELTEVEKREMLHRAATFLEDTWDRFAEVRDLQKRWAVAEKRLAGRNGYSYCPESGGWYPDLPPVIKSLDREYVGLMQEKVFKTCRKLMREIYADGAAKEV